MSKELENLLEDLDSCEEVKTRYGLCYAYSPDIVEELKKAILELKAIKEANPSEALKEIFNIIYNLDCGTTFEQDKKLNECREVLKQSLLKAQEQEKVLKIIFEKKVNILLLYVVDSVDTYNQMYVYYKRNIINVKWCLTQEEFDLLKRYFK